MQNKKYPFAVILILDGWGEAPYSEYNAVKIAKTPNIDNLKKESVYGLLSASGESVGLPKGSIGNSEVGHLHIGAGREVMQEVLVINKEIQNGEFFKNPVLIESIEHAKSISTNIHLIGLISDAFVHSSIDHLFAILKLCSERGLRENVYVHAITDGRDTPPTSSFKYLNMLESAFKRYSCGKISTVHGRYYAMDRDNRWDRIQRSYDALTKSEACKIFNNAFDGIEESYKDGKTDEFVEPFRVLHVGENQNSGLIHQEDTVIFFNFREDRARELTKAFTMEDFNEFKREVKTDCFVSMTEYEKGSTKRIAYEKDIIEDPISAVFAKHNIPQFKIAETEKYAHVTYFFNGGREVLFPLEDRFMIPSLKVPTYDLKPIMRSVEITDEIIKRIAQKKYGLLVANLANADMVGHSGNLKATIKACEYVDNAVGKIAEQVKRSGGILIITADHGNAEVKFNPSTKTISTSHTTNPVPIIINGSGIKQRKLNEIGTLADIAPTVLNAVGLDRSVSMTGNILID